MGKDKGSDSRSCETVGGRGAGEGLGGVERRKIASASPHEVGLVEQTLNDWFIQTIALATNRLQDL